MPVKEAPPPSLAHLVSADSYLPYLATTDWRRTHSGTDAEMLPYAYFRDLREGRLTAADFDGRFPNTDSLLRAAAVRSLATTNPFVAAVRSLLDSTSPHLSDLEEPVRTVRAMVKLGLMDGSIDPCDQQLTAYQKLLFRDEQAFDRYFTDLLYARERFGLTSIGFSTHIGERAENQDGVWFYEWPADLEENSKEDFIPVGFYLVVDGHGKKGREAGKRIAKYFLTEKPVTEEAIVHSVDPLFGLLRPLNRFTTPNDQPNGAAYGLLAVLKYRAHPFYRITAAHTGDVLGHVTMPSGTTQKLFRQSHRTAVAGVEHMIRSAEYTNPTSHSPEIRTIDVQPGTTVSLLTDGLWEELAPGDYEKIMAVPDLAAQEQAEMLLTRALVTAGARQESGELLRETDNTTAFVLRIPPCNE